MTPSQYLAACKTKLGHCSDYALAKKWDIDKGYISKVMRGERPINAHMAMLISITLELDPVLVLAEIEAQQQTGKTGEFWKSFLLRVRQLVGLLALTLACLASAGVGSDQVATGGKPKRRLYFA